MHKTTYWKRCRVKKGKRICGKMGQWYGEFRGMWPSLMHEPYGAEELTPVAVRVFMCEGHAKAYNRFSVKHGSPGEMLRNVRGGLDG